MSSKALKRGESTFRGPGNDGGTAPPPPPVDPGPLGTARAHHGPVALGFLYAVGGLLALYLGQQLLRVGSVLILVVVAMFIAVGLDPAVRWLERRGLTRSLALLAVILVVIAALVLFFVALVPVISDQATRIVDRAPGWFKQLQSNSTVQDLDDRFGIIGKAQDFVTSGKWTSSLFGGVVGIGVAVLGFLVNAFLVTVLTLYFLASLGRTKRALYALAPASRRARVTDLGERILESIGGYVSGAFIVAMCAGLSTLVFLFAIGLGEYAVALAAVVTLLDVIPMIGATLGAVIVTAIAFATDPTDGLLCLVFYVLYQQLENYVIYPRVMQRSVNVPGSVTVIAALIGAGLLGVIGALLAIPTAAAILLILREVVLPRQAAR
jgi:predicted PurR-regulated permease PerM